MRHFNRVAFSYHLRFKQYKNILTKLLSEDFMKKIIYYTAGIISMVTMVCSILSCFGEMSWFLDLFTHFKLQYFLTLVVMGGIVSLKNMKWGLILLPFIFLNGVDIMSIHFGGQKNIDLVKTTKIMSINLLSSNTQFEAVADYISSKEPDILILQEITSNWKSMLEQNLQQYSTRLVILREDNFGIAVYSKVDMIDLTEMYYQDNRLPSISGNFFMGDTQVSLIATHPLPPIGYENAKKRNAQLYDLSSHVIELDTEVIVVGDLNTSSFSSHFKHLLKAANLVDSRKGFGLLPSWPTYFYLLKTTLDHCLVSSGIQVKSREVGQDIGSDHLPIFVELGIP